MIRISKPARDLIVHYEGVVNNQTIKTMIQHGWVDFVNGVLEVVR